MNVVKSQVIKSTVLLTMALVLIGCAGHTSRDSHAADGAEGLHANLPLPDSDPAFVFNLVRETLIDYRFALERVDARRGVITTRPKRTAGLASPWDREQSGMDQEWEDLLNEQRRIVRVDLARDDVTAQYTSVSIRVEVVRSHRPGWRPESESVRLSSHARTRDGQGRLEPASFTEVIGLDTRLADRLLREIESKLSSEVVSP